MNQTPLSNSARLLRIAIILGSSLLGLFIAHSLSPYFPQQYRSSTTLQIKSLQDPSPFEGGDRPNPIYQEFLAKELEFIRSKEILYPVIDSIGLDKKWAKGLSPSRERTYQSLTAAIQTSGIRNTELVQISITGTNPNEAAEIANAIALEYSRRRNAEQNEILSSGIKKQEEEVSRLREKAEAFRLKADEIKTKEGAASEIYQKARAEYEAARRAYEEAEQRLETDKVNTSMPAKPVLIWEKAEPAATSISTPPAIRLALGALLGALIGFILSLFIRR